MAVMWRIRLASVAACLALSLPNDLGALENTGILPQNLKYLSINGWDLVYFGNNPNDTTTGYCALSITVLAQPKIGASGGRVTIRFGNSAGSPLVTATITGGVDPGRPIEMWVDNHLIADRRSDNGKVSFKNDAARNLKTLYKAGRFGHLRFQRENLIVEVPISLNGFTGAVHTAQKKCRS